MVVKTKRKWNHFPLSISCIHEALNTTNTSPNNKMVNKSENLSGGGTNTFYAMSLLPSMLLFIYVSAALCIDHSLTIVFDFVWFFKIFVKFSILESNCFKRWFTSPRNLSNQIIHTSNMTQTYVTNTHICIWNVQPTSGSNASNSFAVQSTKSQFLSFFCALFTPWNVFGGLYI